MKLPTLRKLGRPPIDPTDRSVPFTVRLPSRDFDALCKRASDAQRTVAQQARREFRTQK